MRVAKKGVVVEEFCSTEGLVDALSFKDGPYWVHDYVRLFRRAGYDGLCRFQPMPKGVVEEVRWEKYAAFIAADLTLGGTDLL